MNTTATPGARVRDLLATAGPTISVPEFGKAFGVSRDTAYRLASGGELEELGVRVHRLGRSLRIVTADVRQLLGVEPDEGRPVASTAVPRRAAGYSGTAARADRTHQDQATKNRSEAEARAG